MLVLAEGSSGLINGLAARESHTLELLVFFWVWHLPSQSQNTVVASRNLRLCIVMGLKNFLLFA